MTSERARKRNVVNINLMIGEIPKQLNAGHHFFVALYLFSVMTCQVRLRKVEVLGFRSSCGLGIPVNVLVRAARRPIPFCSNNIPRVNPRLIFLDFNGHRKFIMNKWCDAQSISKTSLPLSSHTFFLRQNIGLDKFINPVVSNFPRNCQMRPDRRLRLCILSGEERVTSFS